MFDEIPSVDREARYPMDPAHLFMRLYDHLPERLFLGRDPINWRDDDEVKECAEAVTELVLIRGGAEYRELAELVKWGGDRGIFTILLGWTRRCCSQIRSQVPTINPL
jgi:hypothetical protein